MICPVFWPFGGRSSSYGASMPTTESWTSSPKGQKRMEIATACRQCERQASPDRRPAHHPPDQRSVLWRWGSASPAIAAIRALRRRWTQGPRGCRRNDAHSGRIRPPKDGWPVFLGHEFAHPDSSRPPLNPSQFVIHLQSEPQFGELPKALARRKAISGEMPDLPLSSPDKALRVTPSPWAAAVTVNPRGSIHSCRTILPGCGGFFINTGVTSF
jgi:hypothetical protein